LRTFYLVRGGEILLQSKEEKSSYKARRRNPPTKQGGEILLQSKEEKSSYKARRIGNVHSYSL
jgi:hypothetical protein